MTSTSVRQGIIKTTIFLLSLTGIGFGVIHYKKNEYRQKFLQQYLYKEK